MGLNGHGPASAWFTPPEIVPFVNEISAVVKSFASEQKLKAESSESGLTVWVLHELKKACGKMRRLQVIVYLEDGRPYFSMVPAIEVVLNPEQTLVPRRSSVIRFPISRVLTYSQFDRKKFRAELAHAWRTAASAEVPAEENGDIVMATGG